jgi:hypothetical protein
MASFWQRALGKRIKYPSKQVLFFIALSGQHGIISGACVGHAHIDLLEPTAFDICLRGVNHLRLTSASQAFAQRITG